MFDSIKPGTGDGARVDVEGSVVGICAEGEKMSGRRGVKCRGREERMRMGAAVIVHKFT